jgi:hypothetical protein
VKALSPLLNRGKLNVVKQGGFCLEENPPVSRCEPSPLLCRGDTAKSITGRTYSETRQIEVLPSYSCLPRLFSPILIIELS